MKLTRDNYFSKEADLYYMSNSQYKAFTECEAQAMAVLEDRWERPQCEALLLGQYIHAWNEDRLAEFVEANKDDIYTKTGRLKLLYLQWLHSNNQDDPRFEELFTKQGKLRSRVDEPFSEDDRKAQFKQIDNLITFINDDPFFLTAIKGEHEVIFTAEMFGVPWKIQIDSYFVDKKRIGDLKCLKSLDEKFWVHDHYEGVLEYRGYNTQMAVYAEIERLANGRAEGDYFEPFLAVVTKEKYPNKEIISYVSLDEGVHEFVITRLNWIEAHIERIKAVKSGKEKPSRCGVCPYCRTTKKLTGTTHYSSYQI